MWTSQWNEFKCKSSIEYRPGCVTVCLGVNNYEGRRFKYNYEPSDMQFLLTICTALGTLYISLSFLHLQQLLYTQATSTLQTIRIQVLGIMNPYYNYYDFDYDTGSDSDGGFGMAPSFMGHAPRPCYRAPRPDYRAHRYAPLDLDLGDGGDAFFAGMLNNNTDSEDEEDIFGYRNYGDYRPGIARHSFVRPGLEDLGHGPGYRGRYGGGVRGGRGRRGRGRRGRQGMGRGF